MSPKTKQKPLPFIEFVVIISLMTKKIKTDEELKGLVYSLTPKIVEEGVVWYKRPAPLAIIVGIVAIILSLLFW